MDYVKDGICKKNKPSERSESIGSYEAFRDLQEPTSLDLLRNSIFRSITNNPTLTEVVDIRDISKKRSVIDFSDITKKDIDVKFLEKKCSSLEKNITKEDKQNILPTPVSPFLESSETCTSLSDISELISKNALESTGESSDGLESFESSLDHSVNESLTESQESLKNNRNSLRLAFSVGSDHGIFENCSTYNITCPHDLSLNRNLSDQRCVDNISGYSSEARNSFPFLPKSIEGDGENSKDSVPCTPDDNSLCDTFFSHVVSGDYVPPQPKESFQPINNRKQSVMEPKQEIIQVNDGDDFSINSVVSEKSRKPNKRIRKRNRKSLSKQPFVYECPKCGVSYTISSKTVGDVACCLHCDLCTSVEPVFMKRDKMTWRTCRIC